MSNWWVVALPGFVGLYLVIRGLATRVRAHREVSSEVSDEIIRRADQQNRWALRGDRRGVYGVKGAELMRGISPEPNVDAELEKATEYRIPGPPPSPTHRRISPRCWPRSCPAGGGPRSSRSWCNGVPRCSRGCETFNSATALPGARVRAAAPRWVASWWIAWTSCSRWSIRWRVSCSPRRSSACSANRVTSPALTLTAFCMRPTD